jgi:hypothetical protein
MPGINLDVLNEQLQRLRADQHAGMPVPDGEYVARVVQTKQVQGRYGRPRNLAVFEVADGSHAGEKIETPVWGNAERQANLAVGGSTKFHVQVYTLSGDDDRERRRVNVEAIRPVGAPPAEFVDELSEVPNVGQVKAAAAEFTRGFRCVGSIGGRRKVLNWQKSYSDMARCEEGCRGGEVVYLSTFSFTTAIDEHQAKNDKEAEEAGKPKKGSLENYRGPCFAQLLTFDTDCRDADGKPDPAGCQHAAVSLVTTLLELGVPPELIGPFYSGSKGFHVQMPSMLAGAAPGLDFHLVAKEFCTLVADRAGVVIDESLYKKLQPLRAPNSRHHDTELYKVRLSLDELIDLPFDAIRKLAKQPRSFVPSSWQCEPVPAIVSLWQQAMRSVRDAANRPALRSADGAVGDAKITRATWDYLINGAVPGTRAESHFKAAANLADFAGIEELVQALMKRPAGLCGLPAAEAEAHVESALRRAAMARPRVTPPRGDGAHTDR